MSANVREAFLTVGVVMLVCIFVALVIYGLTYLASTYGSCSADYVRVANDEFRGCIPWEEAVKRG